MLYPLRDSRPSLGSAGWSSASWRAAPPAPPAYPTTQPPSHRPAEARKTQLFRQYAALLQLSPLILIFQHNNLVAGEWISLRRELVLALARADEQALKERESWQAAAPAAPASVAPRQGGGVERVSDGVTLHVVQKNILRAALRVVEYYRPEDYLQQYHRLARGRGSALLPALIAPASLSSPAAAAAAAAAPTSSFSFDPTRPLSPRLVNAHPELTHLASRSAYLYARQAASEAAREHASSSHEQLKALLTGPVALLCFETLSVPHLAAALSVLAPSAAHKQPAPRRAVAPGYYHLTTQVAVSKMLLLGARVAHQRPHPARPGTTEQVLDVEGLRALASLPGGIHGLRAQLLSLLSVAAGGQLVSTLQSPSLNLAITLDGRRNALEEESKDGGP